MAGPDFFQTLMGRQFYEGTMPRLVRQLERLNENLEKGMTLKQVWLVEYSHKHGIDTYIGATKEAAMKMAAVLVLDWLGDWEDYDDLKKRGLTVEALQKEAVEAAKRKDWSAVLEAFGKYHEDYGEETISVEDIVMIDEKVTEERITEFTKNWDEELKGG